MLEAQRCQEMGECALGMNVLVHGMPFFCDRGIVRRYVGANDIRTFGPDADFDYTYAPLEESASEAIARFTGEWRPDVLLCWQPETYPPPRGIESVSLRTVAMVSDWNVFYPVLEENLSRFDVVLTDRPGVDVFTSERVSPHHIRPLYSQITPVHYPHAAQRDIDVLFIGNLNHSAHRNRARYLERIAKLSDRYHIVITTGIEGEAYGRLMSRARIVFNHSIRGEVNLRVFETMACGAMAMLENANIEVRDWFTDGEDIVLFDEGNFEEKLALFITHPMEAETIAQAGHKRIASMSGEETLDDIIAAVMRLPGSGRKFHSLGELEQIYQTALMYGRLTSKTWRSYVAGLFGHLLDHAPGDARVHTAYVHYLLGDAERDWDRIQQHATRAVDLAPDSIPYALNALTIEEWLTSTKPDSAKLLPLLKKNSVEGAGLLLGTQADPFWTRCYELVAHGSITPDVMHAEILVRSLPTATSFEEGQQRMDLAMNLDAVAGPWLLAHAELVWAHGGKAEAIAFLKSSLPDLPLDVPARERLLEWMMDQGDTDAWKALSEETLQILQAFPETV